MSMYIIPYTSEDEYRNNVDKVLSLLTENVEKRKIILTEGEFSYDHYRHDVIEYAKKYELKHKYHLTIRDNILPDEYRTEDRIKNNAWYQVEYIVCIGTWSSAIVAYDFYYQHPNITIIYIQNSLLPDVYKRDRFEDLTLFNTPIDCMVHSLSSQFQKQ